MPQPASQGESGTPSQSPTEILSPPSILKPKKQSKEHPSTLQRGRSVSKPRKAAASPARTRSQPRTRSRTPKRPDPPGRSPSRRLFCGTPGAATVESPPSTPQRRSAPRANMPTGDKVRRETKRPEAKRKETPVDCHAIKRDGQPCTHHGKTRPTGAVFFYCGKHHAKWRSHER